VIKICGGMNKKIKLLFLSLTVLTIIFTAHVAWADSGYGSLEISRKAAGYQDKNADIFINAQSVVNVVLSLVGFIFFGFILYGGIRWMTARGKEELTTKAKDAITNAIIGLAIVVSAYAITNFVFDFLGKKEGTVTSELGAGECIMDSDCTDPEVCQEGICGFDMSAPDPIGCCTTIPIGNINTKNCDLTTESSCSSGDWSSSKCVGSSVAIEESCHFKNE